MNLQDMVVLYGVAGIGCAVAVLRKEQAHAGWASVASALVTIPLWPLWAPFVLATPRPRERPPERDEPPVRTDGAPKTPTPEGTPRRSPGGAPKDSALARIEYALEESVKAVAGTPMSQVFSRQVAQRIGAEVAVVAQRRDELAALASSRGLDRAASGARLEQLSANGAAERTVATARMQHESLVRLEQLRAADSQALDELADLLEALRAQLLLARYAGSTSDGTGAIVSEVWARLEGLGGAFNPEPCA